MENKLHYLLFLIPLAILGIQQIEKFTDDNSLEPEELNLNTLEKWLKQGVEYVKPVLEHDQERQVTLKLYKDGLK